MQIDRFQIDGNRAVWRSIPHELKAIAPGIVSRVQIYENGLIAGIFFRNDAFLVEGLYAVSVFQNLNDAEDFAVQCLSASRCAPDGT